MNENENVVEENNNPQDVQENNVQPTAVEEKEEGAPEATPEPKTEQSFTQSQVNEIVRTRLEKMQSRLFNRYGVTDRNGLDNLIGKAQSYDVMKERLTASRTELAQIKEENAFIKNNINPARYDDIRAYFKGKGIEFSNDNLINELATHNEWLNPSVVSDKPTTTISTIGSTKQDAPKVDDSEIARKLFGLSKFVR